MELLTSSEHTGQTNNSRRHVVTSTNTQYTPTGIHQCHAAICKPQSVQSKYQGYRSYRNTFECLEIRSLYKIYTDIKY